jgi:hypothetical protein
MSRFAFLAFFVVLSVACSHPEFTAPFWQGTFLGGRLVDDCDAVATDGTGNVYLACHVASVDLPGVTGAAIAPGNPMNAYVVKLTAALDTVEWGVLLAGSQYDGAFDIAVDARGHVFVAGLTASPDFPVTANALQKHYGGGEADAFFAEIDPEGKLLEVSFLGGSGADRAFALEVGDGTLWLGGATSSSDFPGIPTAASNAPRDADAFVARISLESERRIRSTFIGGRGYETHDSILRSVDSES